VHKINKAVQKFKILQILFRSIVLQSALTTATASAKHFGVKVIKYFAVLCIDATVTGVTISDCNELYMRSVT